MIAQLLDSRIERVTHRPLKEIGSRLFERVIRQHWEAFGMRKDLTVQCRTPKATIPLIVRTMEESDWNLIYDKGYDRPPAEQEILDICQELIKAGVQTPYVAADALNNHPCFFQWLMRPEQNDEIQRTFNARFPRLREDQALLEYAYTVPRYRRMGIMAAGMALIADQAREFGAKEAIMFVPSKKDSSLRSCKKAGFAPYLVRREAKYLFRIIKTKRFDPI
ncbi:MAG: GNAT family N-acetyltransferase [Deltaproteobacteria bacterium]|nr:GNAT family N-acetyltransferase [Deltaproteobacteria bacterium]